MISNRIKNGGVKDNSTVVHYTNNDSMNEMRTGAISVENYIQEMHQNNNNESKNSNKAAEMNV